MHQRRMGKAGYVFMGLLVLAFIALMVVFAFQTYFLVSTIFPQDNVWMQWITVFSFDGCCTIYAGLELFYHFKWQYAREMVSTMWWATFIGSLLCTVVYITMSSDHLLHQIVNVNILYAAYAIVTIVFCGDIVAIAVLLKSEYVAHQEWKYGKGAMGVPPSPAPQQRVSVREDAPSAFQQALPAPRAASWQGSNSSGSPYQNPNAQQKHPNQQQSRGMSDLPSSIADRGQQGKNGQNGQQQRVPRPAEMDSLDTMKFPQIGTNTNHVNQHPL